MKQDYKNIYELYTQLKSEREKYKSLWDSISKFTGIGVEPDYMWNNSESNKNKQLDEFVDDPTSAISVNQAGDYMNGIMWGTGDKVFSLVPSRYVTELIDPALVKDYYGFATDQALYHMNHSDAGLNTAMKPYSYDQFSFGTSGVGAFANKDFIDLNADNALVFRNYGIDNIAIDEGKSGQVEYVFCVYHWKINRIVGEFCKKDGEISKEVLKKLPKALQNAWNKNDYNTEFNIVFGVCPRSDYNAKLKGKRGTKYQGFWFLDQPSENNIFHEESFAERPILVARQVKIRGEAYGRSAGTMLLSTIRSVNFMLSTTIEIIEKMANPSLGVLNNAIFGDSVLDSSPNGMTIFNSALANGQQPVFPLFDVGDPSAIIQFLIPYLNEKVTTAFKIDALLDFSSAKKMTATESLQRYAIRGKSLAGLLMQQKCELLEPLTKRCISLLMGMNELGVNPFTMEKAAETLKKNNRSNRIIPPAVLQVMESGRPWYEIKWNNELEKLTRTEAVQNLLQILQAIGGIASLYPKIIEAVDWYKLLKDINDNLDSDSQIIKSEKEFKAIIEGIAKQQQAAMMLQAGQAGAQIQKDTSQANKNNNESLNAR